MKNHSRNQQGFGAVGVLAVVLVIVIIGVVGTYVWQKNHKSKVATTSSTTAKSTTSATTNTSTSTQTQSRNSTQRYLTISEWGVRAPYNGPLTLGYTISSDNYAQFNSAQLIAADANCKNHGGAIQRYLPNDSTGPQTAAQAAVANPGQYILINGYYYTFVHDQASCSDNASATDLQTQTNSVVKALVPELVAVPSS